jgi:hypothetical protein
VRWAVIIRVLYFLAMVAVIVTIDVLFLRNLFWIRLIVNVGIVAVALVSYWIFIR